jgi:hypothetical protein
MAERHERIETVDNSGKRVAITKVTPRLPAASASDPHASSEGPPTYFLADGTRLHRTPNGFETVCGTSWFTRV